MHIGVPQRHYDTEIMQPYQLALPQQWCEEDLFPQVLGRRWDAKVQSSVIRRPMVRPIRDWK
jgi:hypothetical protein